MELKYRILVFIFATLAFHHLKAQEEKDKTGRNAKDLRTAKINERNQLGNILRMDHAKSQVQQQAEAGAMNPFMRRATRPKILWDMHNGDKEESKKKDDDEKNKEDNVDETIVVQGSDVTLSDIQSHVIFSPGTLPGEAVSDKDNSSKITIDSNTTIKASR